MAKKRQTRLTLFDKTEGGPLEFSWVLGGAIDRGLTRGVATWAQAMAEIERAYERNGGHPLEVQFWCHGNDGKVWLNGANIPVKQFCQRMRGMIKSLWFRSCETARGNRGRALLKALVDGLNCVVAAHCVRTSAPNPLWQGSGVALRPGEKPWWDAKGRGRPGCSIFRMRIPKKFYRGGGK